MPHPLCDSHVHVHALHALTVCLRDRLRWQQLLICVMAQVLVCLCVAWDWKRGPAAHDINWQVDEHEEWGFGSAVKCIAQIYDGTETGMDRIRRGLQAAFPQFWWTFDHAVARQPSRPPPLQYYAEGI